MIRAHTAVGPGRQAYIDLARGLAVLVMIEAHVLDGWTRLPDRATHAFGYAMILGGFAAPLFLFLAGLGLVLSAESKFRKTGDLAGSWKAVRNRGWQILLLAFLFRLQSYILTGGYSLAGLLKVDILNIMGPAMVVAALLGGLTQSTRTRVALFACAAVVMAMLAPIVRITPHLNFLPDPIEWYFRPSPTRTNFTLFPWAGFVFAGAVLGTVINAMRDAQDVWRVQGLIASAAVLTAWVGYQASFLPTIYERSEFWTTSPTFFFLRVGVIALVLPLAFAWERAPWRGLVSHWSPVQELGRASLFVYWIHVEMVYGFISRPLRRVLSFEGALVAYALFSIFILGLVVLKNRLVTARNVGTLRSIAPQQPVSSL